MSHSGSSEYPLPLTGPISKSELSSSGLATQYQNTIEYGNGGVNSSTSRRVPTSSSQDEFIDESLKIYSVKTHQRRKQITSPVGDKTETNLSNVNNNIYQLEKEVRLNDNLMHFYFKIP